MANHHTRQIPDLSEAQRQELQRWVRRSKTAQALVLRGADRAGDRRRQERHGGSRRTGHDPRDGRQVAAAVPARRLRRLAGRAASRSATHDRGRRRGARGRAYPGDDPRRRHALEHAVDGQGVWAESNDGEPHLARVSVSSHIATRPSSCRAIRCSSRKYATSWGLYLHPPERAVVLCVDEKPQIQALERSQPVLPMRPGVPQRRTPRLPPPRDHVVVRGLGRGHRHGARHLLPAPSGGGVPQVPSSTSPRQCRRASTFIWCWTTTAPTRRR